MDLIYGRQSVDKKDSISIEGQIELCKKECHGEFKVFSDKGYSGKNIDRPAFKEMMKLVEHGGVERIIVYRLDRISRSITDFGRIWDFLNSHHTEFVSVNEKFDTSTPVGRAMVYIIMVFAQLERETIAERIKDNYHQRARRGAFLGGPAPFGFQIERTVIGGKAASMLKPNDDTAILQQIFEKYAYSNVSLSKIAAWLVEQKVPGIGRKTWDNVSISRILHNPSYVKADADIYYFYKQKGLIMYNDIDEYTGQKALWLFGKRDRGMNKYADLHEQLLAIAHHDGVIDSKTFLICQNKLDSNRQIKNTGSGKYSWLSGIIKCGYCGYSMRVISSNGYVYFSCSGKTNLKLCTAKHIKPYVDAVEKNVSKQIQQEMDRLKSEKIDTPPPADLNSEKIELVKIEQQISNLLDSLSESNSVTMRYINERLLKLDDRKTELLNKINESTLKPDLQIPDGDFESLSFDDKKELAKTLIDKVLLTNEEVKVIFKY